jgi:hypothetical protein
MRETVYISSPYTDNDPAVRAERVRENLRAMRYLLGRGYSPVSPVVLADRLIEDESGLPFGSRYWPVWNKDLIGGCRSLVVLPLPGWAAAEGVHDEAAYAAGLCREVGVLAPCGRSYGLTWGWAGRAAGDWPAFVAAVEAATKSR